MFRTPTEVLMMIGQIEVMKITNNADGWASRKPASDKGSQASGGIVRSTWKIGSSPRIAQVLCPTNTPKATPTTAATLKPMATRPRLLEICQKAPLSMPPLSKNGSAMKSQASVTTLLGDGSGAPGAEQSNCQTKSVSPITIS